MRKLICLMLALLLPVLPLAAMAEEATVPTVENVLKLNIPGSEALRFVSQIKVGWNLGNTFDAHKGNNSGDEMALEKYWCGIYTTPEMIQALKDAGFNAIRIPVSWHNHVDQDFNISEKWLSRVQEVVDYAISRDMFVILNIHHDTDKKFVYPDSAHYEQSERFITSIWQQVSERFKEYDNKLIFECINETRLAGTNVEWWFNTADPRIVDAADCINRLNQAFVNTVRATGGSNTDRYLMVSGYAASPDGTKTDYFTLPTDTAENKLIVSVHAYTPYSFALEMPGTDTFLLETQSDFGEICTFMNQLYTRYVSKGIPVIIGEFGALNKDNLQDRVNFTAYYVANATARGMPCFWWDNNHFKGNGERFGLLDRKTCTFPDTAIVDALMQYSGITSFAE
ncbi:MAG: glycoside hydrolase family 5 protein [Clostridiales bacterium]|nr:glycoside hydrolase family 5 protein [Clostridiales bacterium]